MKFSRRSLLLGGLGLTQATLISKYGHKLAHAAGAPKPTKFMTIYVPGGWMPALLFPPFSNAVINTHLKSLAITATKAAGGTPAILGQTTGVPHYFDSAAVLTPATGALGADVGANATKQALRMPRLWNPAAPTVAAAGFDEHGYAWVQNRLHNKTCVIHGVDQGTAAHESGVVSAVSGAAGSQFRAPSANAVIAAALWPTYKDARPLPSVTLNTTYFTPNAQGLPGYASPTVLGTPAALNVSVSDRNDGAWKDLRDRSLQPVQPFDPMKGAAENVSVTALDQYVLAQTLAQRGLSSEGTDAFYSGIYDGLKSTSKLLASDVVGKLQSLPAIKADFDVRFGIAYGEGGNAEWKGAFDMALRLIRSDLVTSVSLNVKGNGNFFFDTHADPFDNHIRKLRQVQEVLGRFLGEMDSIPASSGVGSLLDETLVLICSEFSRTYTNNGHWPTTSAVLVGGGIHGNLMVGNYDLEGKPAPYDPIGVPIDILDDGGAAAKAIPKSADVIATIYATFGVKDFFIPGGYGEILGVRAT
jgi:hypothetical protein